MNIGKLTNEELQSIVLDKISVFRDDVVLRPGIGVDCGAIAMSGDDVCVLSTDPITGAAHNIGRLAVHVSCNDAAAAGAEPVGLLLCIMAPPDAALEDIKLIIEQAAATAAQINVEIIGGHTEITDAVCRVVVISTVVGRTVKGKLLSAAGAKPGDSIIVTKNIALEGTSIIASDYAGRIDGILSENELRMAQGLSESISVVKEGMIARNLPVTAMHDITEGGVFGAIWEMCEASKLGACVEADKIPVLGVTLKICDSLGLDPYRLISSGSMLIASPEPERVCGELMKAGVPAAAIGTFNTGEIMYQIDGKQIGMHPPGRDELFKLA